jgi:hypothetical protein
VDLLLLLLRENARRVQVREVFVQHDLLVLAQQLPRLLQAEAGLEAVVEGVGQADEEAAGAIAASHNSVHAVHHVCYERHLHPLVLTTCI